MVSPVQPRAVSRRAAIPARLSAGKQLPHIELLASLIRISTLL